MCGTNRADENRPFRSVAVVGQSRRILQNDTGGASAVNAIVFTTHGSGYMCPHVEGGLKRVSKDESLLQPL